MNIDHLMSLVNAKINDDARRAGVMTLGALRTVLNAYPSDTVVVVDQGGSPYSIKSYRGYYERLALDVESAPHTVAQVVGLLDSADGQTFMGYKGGHYYMDGTTFIHVAAYGSTGVQVVGVHLAGDRVVIDTDQEVF